MDQRDVKLSALLIWLAQRGGIVDAESRGLDRYSDDFEPTDTLNRAFEAGFAKQVQHGDDDFTIQLTPAGLAAVEGRPDAR